MFLGRSHFWALAMSILPVCLNEAAGRTPMSETDSLYQVAVAQARSMPVAERIKGFERVVAADRKYAPAYCEMAKLYLTLDTPEDRKRAERAVREALRLDRRNAEYALLLGDVMWEQGMWAKAEAQYEKALEKEASAHAAYRIGYIAFKNFVKYRDMTHRDALGTFSWRRFGREDRERAVAYLKRSIQIDADFRDAYFALGAVYVESNQPQALIRLFVDLLARHPDDKDGLMFCGLGHQMAGDFQTAERFYTAAMDVMGPEERALMESVDLIADGEEKAAILAAGGGQAHTDAQGKWEDSPALAEFWRKQDPLFLTEFNERRMEHYRRVAYANLRFSRPLKGIPGWQTDMGKTYIKFGRPVHRAAQRPYYESGRVKPHREIWFYEGFKVAFINWDGLDHWGFFSPTMDFGIVDAGGGASIVDDQPSGLAEFKQQPQRYVDPYADRKYSIPHLAAAFQENDSVRVEVSYMIPKARLMQSGAEQAVFLSDGVFFFDERWQTVYRKCMNPGLRLPPAPQTAGTDSLRKHYLLSQRTVRVAPGQYHVAAEVMDRASKSISTFRDLRTLSSQDIALTLSDLLQASRIEAKNPFPERRSGLTITPNPLRTYYRSEPVFVYFEIYNLARNAFGRTEYEISYRVSPPREDEIDPALFLALDLLEAGVQVTIETVTRTEDGTGQRPFAGEAGTEPVQPEASQPQAVDYRVRYVLPENRLAEKIEELRPAGGRMETAITVRYEGDREDDFTYLQIDIRHVPCGVHKLTVTARDVHTGQTAEREVLFRVVE